MQIAYVDESGYTGRDLLNADQPFMSLAALFIESDMADDLKARHFPRLQAPELKHKDLAKHSTHFGSLLSIQRECLRNCRGISYIVDKRYMCILKMLDDCIEPVHHSLGHDFYANGGHLALASLIHATAPAFWGAGELDKLLGLYQTASKEKTHESVRRLCDHARSLQGRELADSLAPIASMHPAFIDELTSPDTSTNIAFSLLSGLMSKIEEFAHGPYELVHDRSPAMRKFHGLISVMKANVPSQHFRISDICQVSYPMQLSSVREEDSKAECGLQLADLLAGGVIAAARAISGLDSSNDYTSNVFGQYSDDNLIFMLPDTDFKSVATRFASNDISASIDEIARRVAGNH